MTNKTTVVNIRMSEADKAQITAAAEARGLSLSAFVRMVMLSMPSDIDGRNKGAAFRNGRWECLDSGRWHTD